MPAAVTKNLNTRRFSPGRLITTAGVHRRITADGFDYRPYLSRHLSDDWGDLCEDDARLNDRALATGRDRIFSSYDDTPIGKLWIITEWDRSVTTILFPEEY